MNKNLFLYIFLDCHIIVIDDSITMCQVPQDTAFIFSIRMLFMTKTKHNVRICTTDRSFVVSVTGSICLSVEPFSAFPDPVLVTSPASGFTTVCLATACLGSSIPHQAGTHA